ncbi:MAG: helix-turn-helix transcriptional regulator [Clostridiales Family XIII bacterium]|jgi:DNA-binding HxlR family transcriptional regulator|nr:helix-turn-helix transcriptional regulator [Clostridiales Family XIII bacterium]
MTHNDLAERTLALLAERWTVRILRELLLGTRRFGELKRTLAPVSQKMLTERLRGLEAEGLLTRCAFPEVPPRVEYSLTETGQSLQPILEAAAAWGQAHSAEGTPP